MAKIENVIYIITNPQYPGYIKIGYASDLKQRLASLNTGALIEFQPYAVYETPKDKGDIEIHRIIELLNPILRASKFDNGKTKLKEFFKLEPEEAYELLEHIAIVSGTRQHLYRVSADYKRIYDNPITVEHTHAPKPAAIKPQHVEVPAVSDDAVSVIPNGTYYFKRKIKRLNNQVLTATMTVADGVVTLKAGSDISPTEGGGCSERLRELRKNAQIVNDTLRQDIVCSLNEAAGMIIGGAINSWMAWTNDKGEVIDVYRKK